MDALFIDTGLAALQHNGGAIAPSAKRLRWTGRVASAAVAAPIKTMTVSKPRELLIKGLTKDGKTFRPSDWSERLAGAMSCFRPEGSQGGIAAFIGYSPYCVPRTIDGVKCVIVSEELRGVEPMAWDFVMSFARDNQLEVADEGVLPEPPSGA